MTDGAGMSRGELYGLVWSEPMTKVGARFSVSGSYLARICTLLNVPRPERGYWAKLAVGNASQQPSLPEARPGDPIHWAQDGAPMPRLPPQAPRLPQKRSRVKIEKDQIHALVRGAKTHFESGRPVEDGEYLRPYKRLLLDLNSSGPCLGRALEFANELFNAFESAGHRVMSTSASGHMRRSSIEEREKPATNRDPYYYGRLWSPQHPTVVYIGTVAIGLAIVEMSENVLVRRMDGKYIREADFSPPPRGRVQPYSFTTNMDLPSGRLRLVAYCPYGRVTWSTQWQETGTATLSSKIAGIIREIEKAVPQLVEQLEEAARQAEIAHQKWLADMEKHHRTEDRKRVEKSVVESREQLEQVIKQWSAVVAIGAFFDGIEKRAVDLDGEEGVEVRQRVALARKFLGSQDALDFFRAWLSPEERYAPKYGNETDT